LRVVEQRVHNICELDIHVCPLSLFIAAIEVFIDGFAPSNIIMRVWSDMDCPWIWLVWVIT